MFVLRLSNQASEVFHESKLCTNLDWAMLVVWVIRPPAALEAVSKIGSTTQVWKPALWFPSRQKPETKLPVEVSPLHHWYRELKWSGRVEYFRSTMRWMGKRTSRFSWILYFNVIVYHIDHRKKAYGRQFYPPRDSLLCLAWRGQGSTRFAVCSSRRS